jgi:DNA repair exonuclease SbcCD ATPase subunit
MRIRRLYTRDVKRIRVVDISPEGNTVVVAGRNGEGKSSVLDSIMYALAGGRTLPEEPIRRGAKNGETKIDLGELKVRRRYTAKGSTLEVTGKDGTKLTSPQKILEALVGTGISFNPLEFMRAKPAAQVEDLRKLLGLDFSDLDESRKKAYDQRTSVNRELKATQARADAIEVHPDAPDEPIEVGDLVKDLEAIKARNAALDDHKVTEGEARQEIVAISERLKQLKVQIEELETEQERLKGVAAEAAKAWRGKEREDEDEARTKIDKVGEINAACEAKRQRLAMEKEAEALEASASDLTAKIETLDAEREERIASKELPVPGLGFGDGCVTYNDIPLSQASSAEQLRVAVGMALAMSKDLPIVLIRDGSLLDEDSLAAVKAMAEEADGEVWIERVDPDAENAVIIEDGQVKGEA